MRPKREGIVPKKREFWFDKDDPARITAKVLALEAEDQQERARLLRGALAGNLQAELELYQKYKCRVYVPVGRKP